VYLLLETGDRLLLETGDGLLLENATPPAPSAAAAAAGAFIVARDAAQRVARLETMLIAFIATQD